MSQEQTFPKLIPMALLNIQLMELANVFIRIWATTMIIMTQTDVLIMAGDKCVKLLAWTHLILPHTKLYTPAWVKCLICMTLHKAKDVFSATVEITFCLTPRHPQLPPSIPLPPPPPPPPLPSATSMWLCTWKKLGCSMRVDKDKDTDNCSQILFLQAALSLKRWYKQTVRYFTRLTFNTFW